MHFCCCFAKKNQNTIKTNLSTTCPITHWSPSVLPDINIQAVVNFRQGTGRGELQHLALRISFRSFESFMVMQKKSEAVWGGINNKSSMHLLEAAEEPNLIRPSCANPYLEIAHDGWVEYRWENSVLYWFKKKISMHWFEGSHVPYIYISRLLLLYTDFGFASLLPCEILHHPCILNLTITSSEKKQ